MFCPPNEKLQNFTEKTKLLAQKCTHQIRAVAQQHLQSQQQQQQQQQQEPQHQQQKEQQQQQQQLQQKPDYQQLLLQNSPKLKTRRRSYEDHFATDENKKNNFKYLCSCTGGTLRGLKTRKNKNGHPTVKWYVKPTWRLWGEEREKDAIFTVYLKKVRYHRPIPSANHDSDDEISHLEWETVRVRFVKAASLSRLVEALATDDGELESTFINVFLSTYRTFSNTKEVLDLLIKRYETLNDMIIESQQHQQQQHQQELENSSSSSSTSSVLDGASQTSEQHKKTLVQALHVWLDGFPEDWNEDNLRHILGFTSKRLPKSDLHTKILHRLDRLLRISTHNHHQPYQHYHPNNQYNHHHCQDHILGVGGLGIIGAGGGVVGGGGGGCSSGGSSCGWSSPQSYLYQHPDFVEQFGGLCLAPALRGPPTHLLQAYRFPNVPVKHFAEQLTRMDMELFKRLIPHQCLGATWAKREKNEAETVVATVNQFNAVSFRVISSILIEPRLKPHERALNIVTWVDIAQELRLLKNFSSLKAIISGLQSNAIYRLSKTWAALSREKLEIFNELARIFSEDNNAWAQREVLMREGTAKFADTVGENDRHLQKVFQKQNTHTSHGTIPYLGTFLTDLTMIHVAIPDTIGDSLINFDKKRKEFEVLAQIKLLQGSANSYNLREDLYFDRWFASMLVLDERESHALSCQLEPPTEPRKSNSSSGHRKTDSIASNSSSGAGSQFYCEIHNASGGGGGATTNTTITTNSSLNTSSSRHSSRHNSLDRDVIPPLPPNSSSIMSASSSVSNLSIDSSNSGGGGGGQFHQHYQQQQQHYNVIKHNSSGIGNGKIVSNNHSSNNNNHHNHNNNNNNNNNNNGGPIINAQLVQNSPLKNSSPDFYIIKVTYETDNVELDGIILYKSIMLGNNERTPQVIRNSMMKLGLDGDPDKYTLAQVLPDKELVMPPNANVYYAVNTAYNLNFILRPKKDDTGQ